MVLNSIQFSFESWNTFLRFKQVSILVLVVAHIMIWSTSLFGCSSVLIISSCILDFRFIRHVY